MKTSKTMPCPLCKVMEPSEKESLLFCERCEIFLASPETYENTFTSALVENVLADPVDLMSYYYLDNNPLWYAKAFSIWFVASMAVLFWMTF